MSDSRSLPVFNGVQNRVAAEALSQPFIRPADFVVAGEDGDMVTPELDPDKLAAIGMLYVERGGDPEFEFAMHPSGPTPYAAAQEFVTGYDRTITPLHAREGLARHFLSEADNEIALNRDRRTAIECAGEGDVNAMAAYVLFAFERTGYTGMLIASRSIVTEAPLRTRESQLRLEQLIPDLFEASSAMVGEAMGISKEQIEQHKRDIATNTARESEGMTIATFGMPGIQTLRKVVDADLQVDGFLSLPRKERRGLLKAEQKRSGGEQP